MLNVISSMEPLTEFSPTWHIPIWSARYQNFDNLDLMRDWIVTNEPRLIEKYGTYDVRNDGGTGLGLNSLTAQYNKFNLFRETADIPAFQDLLSFILAEYKKFMVALEAPERSCLMYSWANVMRTGQKVDTHNHGASHYAYISGNMHFDNYNTVTRYFNPYGEIQYDYQNQKGGLTFFPSYLMHGTTEHLEEGNRVSMAFDLLDKTHLPQADANNINFN